MPFRENQVGFSTLQPTPEKEPYAPTWQETFSAAFEMENDVLNAVELLNKPSFARDPQFDWIKKLRESPYWEDYRDNFVGTRNEDEYNFRIGQIEEERKARGTLERAGTAGFVAQMAAGVVSPTMYLPFLGQGRSLKTVFQAAGWGVVGGTLQELPLQQNQETRTLDESLLSIGSSTVLSGLLGGAVMMLRPKELDALSQSVDVSRGEISIFTQSAGAAASRALDAGTIENVAARSMIKLLDSNAITRSPVTSTIMGDSVQARSIMSQYADAGLSMEGNKVGIPTSPGGTIENAIKLHSRKFEDAVRSIDEEYSNYFFNNQPPKVGSNILSTVGGHFSRTYMSKADFRKEVGRAMFQGDEHSNPYVKKVVDTIRRQVYEPMLKELQEVGLMKDEIGLLADPTYLNRLYDTDRIKANVKNSQGKGFRELLAEEFQIKLQADFAERLAKQNESVTRQEELLEDIARPEDEIKALREEFMEELKGLEENLPENIAEIEDRTASLRSQARDLRGAPKTASFDPDKVRKELLKDARDVEKALEESEFYKGIPERRATLRRRLRNLNKAQVVLEKKHQRKLEKIEKAEELSLKAMTRVARAGKRILNKLDSWSDDVLDKKLSELRSTFGEMARLYDKGEERIAKLAGEVEEGEENAAILRRFGMEKSAERIADETDPTKAVVQTEEQRQLARQEKLNTLASAIEDLDDPTNRELVRDTAEAVLSETMSRAQDIIERRAVRTARLEAAAKAMEPEKLDERISAIKNEGEARTSRFNEGIRNLGADSFDPVARTADFTRFAEEQAQAIVDKILGTFIRLPTVDVLQDKRGATLARVLDIPSEKLLPWLETDIEKLVRSHIYTMGPDVEIARKFQGSVNMDEILAKMWDERDAANKMVESATVVEKPFRKWVKQQLGIKLKEGEALTDKQKEQLNVAIHDKYQSYKDNIIAVHERLRHTWGLPKDPDGAGYRLGRLAANLNVLRYMGMVTVSSIPDMAAPIFKYGLTHVFKEGFIPLVTNFKAFKMSAREAKYAGVANDVVLNSRAQTVLDIVDDLKRGSKFERGVEYLTNRQGIVAGFNYWTDGMKQWMAVNTNARLMDSIARVVANDDKKAGQYLASVGIGPEEAVRIWDQALAVGAANKVNGVWLPNTEAWTDAAALRFYRTALAREVDRGVVTPGVERPLWTNATMSGKLISQFKSFAFASTYRTTLAGLQQRDMAFVNGMMVSMGLGAMSYYLASLSNQKAYEEMQDAGPGRWADEAMQRSGVLAVFGLGQDLLSRIPLTSPYSSFSGGRTTRRGGDDLLETIAGPTYGDLLPRLSDVITGLDDPTLSTQHKVRTMLPWQNLVHFRHILDQIEQANPLNLPERRAPQ